MILAISDVGVHTDLNAALLAIPGVAMSMIVGLPDADPPQLKHLVICENDWEVSIWQDRRTSSHAADVAVFDPDGESVQWGGASLLVDQPIDSVLSLIRMVAKEGQPDGR